MPRQKLLQAMSTADHLLEYYQKKNAPQVHAYLTTPFRGSAEKKERRDL